MLLPLAIIHPHDPLSLITGLLSLAIHCFNMTKVGHFDQGNAHDVRLSKQGIQCLVSRQLQLIHLISSTHLPTRDTHTPATMSKCHLLSLPAELRIEIYYYALVPSSPQEIPLRHERQRTPSKLALLQTCHQINNEATPVFYTHTVFEKHHCGDFKLDGISQRSFLKVQHFRFVLLFRVPDSGTKYRATNYEQKFYAFFLEKTRPQASQFAGLLKRLRRQPGLRMQKDAGIDSLTLSNYDTWTAAMAWDQTNKPIGIKYRREIDTSQYEIRKPPRKGLKTTVQLEEGLTRLENYEAVLKGVWEPFLRIRPEKLKFEGLRDRRIRVMGLGPGRVWNPKGLGKSATEEQNGFMKRWTMAPRWMVEDKG